MRGDCSQPPCCCTPPLAPSALTWPLLRLQARLQSRGWRRNITRTKAPRKRRVLRVMHRCWLLVSAHLGAHEHLHAAYEGGLVSQQIINPTSGPIKRWCSGHANEAKVLVEQPCRYSDLVIALHPSAHYDSPSRPSTNPNHSPLASPPSPPLATPIRALSPEALSLRDSLRFTIATKSWRKITCRS